nr:MAG TPA: hypothetical protein [Myoviridae sp. ctsKG11]DAM75067.1 MAG TPA: hypothetical protein [Caudoviricetes sp.]
MFYLLFTGPPMPRYPIGRRYMTFVKKVPRWQAASSQ